ncbi:MAG: peptide synthase [Nitrospinaceae bacterium]|nr:MAG: peptide synthase [Nitrospinaceae bacterium]
MQVSKLNISVLLEQIADEIPQTPAIIVPWQKRQVTFLELHEESNRLASGLIRLGISKGDRTLLLVPFGVEFITLTFALFKTGAIPVLIDPGLGRKNMLQCIGQAQPRGLVAIPQAHAAKIIFPGHFKDVEISITVGRRWFWGGKTLKQVRKLGSADLPLIEVNEGDPAAILFTSGSTGPSKGVLYTHEMFFHQIEVLRSCFGIRQGEIDLPTFPLFGLFSACMGMTCILPKMDFTRPAKVDPENIIKPIKEFSITNSFGSPALWETVSNYCIHQKIKLPSLKRILMAGAPIPGTLIQKFDPILEDSAEIHTPYGATEALPVSSIERKTILSETWRKTRQGMGMCVGHPVPGIQLKIIKVTDDPVPLWDPGMEQPALEVGEVAVQGPWVTRKYFNDRNDANALAKIADGDHFWHRMGDLGWLDEQGRLWFCGRKSQRVITKNSVLYTIPCEAIFNVHPKVKRSALVGVGEKGQQEAVIVVEPENKELSRNSKEGKALIQDLLELGRPYPHTEEIRFFLFHPEFPVDIRHNAKIFREQLATWAEEEITE